MVAKQRGDTLVEVMLSMALLGLVTVGVFSVMQRGVGLAQNSLERSQTRTELSAQAEMLNYLRDQYAIAVAKGSSTTVYPMNVWADIKTRAFNNRNTAPTSVSDCSTTSPTIMANSFILDSSSGTIVLTPYNAASYTLGNTIWVEPIGSPSSANPAYQKYVDLYIKTCYASSFGGAPQLMSTVVRLYDR